MILRDNEWHLEPHEKSERSRRLLRIAKEAWQRIPAEDRDDIVQGLRCRLPADARPPGLPANVPANAVCFLKLGLRIEIVPGDRWQALLKSRKFPPSPAGSTGIFSFTSDMTARGFPGRSVIVNEAIVEQFPDHALIELLLHELGHAYQRAYEMTGSAAFLEVHADSMSERWGGGFSHDRGPSFEPGPRTAFEIQRMLKCGRYTSSAMREFKAWNNRPKAAAFWHGTGSGVSPTVTLEVSDSPIEDCCAGGGGDGSSCAEAFLLTLGSTVTYTIPAGATRWWASGSFTPLTHLHLTVTETDVLFDGNVYDGVDCDALNSDLTFPTSNGCTNFVPTSSRVFVRIQNVSMGSDIEVQFNISTGDCP